MGKVAVAAAVGIGVAGILLAAIFLGVHLSPTLLMSIAAALSVGAATSVLTRFFLDTSKPKPGTSELLGKRLRDVKGLIAAFPKGSNVLQYSIRSDTPIDELEVVKNPAGCLNREIIVTLRDAGKDNGKIFNPVMLKRLFVALKDQPNFLHLVLADKHDEYVGYIPGFRVKSEFTGAGAEAKIVRYIVDVFADHAKSTNLHEIDGVGTNEIINDEAKIFEALARVGGGFHRFVVLRGGRHRKPIGLLLSEQLLAITKPMAG